MCTHSAVGWIPHTVGYLSFDWTPLTSEEGYVALLTPSLAPRQEGLVSSNTTLNGSVQGLGTLFRNVDVGLQGAEVKSECGILPNSGSAEGRGAEGRWKLCWKRFSPVCHTAACLPPPMPAEGPANSGRGVCVCVFFPLTRSPPPPSCTATELAGPAGSPPLTPVSSICEL